MARVCIVIPLYNRRKVILDTIHSVIAQTFSDWHLIVVDDGSTDGSLEIVQKRSSQDTRISVLQRLGEQKGGNICRNQGLRICRSEYIIFLDSDDILQPNCLLNRVDKMDRNPNLDFLVFPGATFESESFRPNFFWNVPKDDPDICRFLNLDSPWQTSGPIWRTKFLKEKALLWDETLALWQDVDFHIRVLLHRPNYKMFWEDPVDYLVRQDSPDSLSRASYYSNKKVSARISFLFNYMPLWKEHGMPMNNLRYIFLVAAKSAAKVRQWNRLNEILTQGLKFQVIKKQEYISLKVQLNIARLLPAALFDFPNRSSRNMLVGERALTLQVVTYTNIHPSIHNG